MRSGEGVRMVGGFVAEGRVTWIRSSEAVYSEENERMYYIYVG